MFVVRETELSGEVSAMDAEVPRFVLSPSFPGRTGSVLAEKLGWMSLMLGGFVAV